MNLGLAPQPPAIVRLRRSAGEVKFLGSPKDVIDLVVSGHADQYVILAQGGTTTFLSPILAEFLGYSDPFLHKACACP